MSEETSDYFPMPRRRSRARFVWLALVVVTLGAVTAIFVSGANRALSTGARVKCASNLRQTGEAIRLYAKANDDRMPTDLRLLITTNLPPEVFKCPGINHVRSPGTQPSEWRANLTSGGHLSYVYVHAGGPWSRLDPADVVLFEPAANHGDDGANVLFAGVYVEWVEARTARAIADQHAAGVRPVRLPAVATQAAQ